MSHSPSRQGPVTSHQESGAPKVDRQAVQSELEASDLEMVRVLEDLINALVDKGVIMMTDLPKAAQNKIASRGNMRSKLSDLVEIVGENDDLMLP